MYTLSSAQNGFIGVFVSATEVLRYTVTSEVVYVFLILLFARLSFRDLQRRLFDHHDVLLEFRYLDFCLLIVPTKTSEVLNDVREAYGRAVRLPAPHCVIHLDLCRLKLRSLARYKLLYPLGLLLYLVSKFCVTLEASVELVQSARRCIEQTCPLLVEKELDHLLIKLLVVVLDH